MSASTTALVYVFLGQCLAFLAVPAVSPVDRGRFVVLWAGSAAILFLVQDFALVMMCAGLLWLALSFGPPAKRYALYLNAMACLPTYIVATVPFPGLNYLAFATPQKIASLVILLPAFMSGEGRRTRWNFNAADWAMVAYTVYVVSIVTVFGNFTGGLRSALDVILLLGLPYFTVRRFVDTIEDVQTALRAALLASLVLGGVAVISTIKQWDVYRLLSPASVFSIPDTRSGFVRIEATSNTHSLGYHLAVGLIILEMLRPSLNLTWWKLAAIRILMLAGLYVTDSKGAAGGLIVAVLIFSSLTSRNPFVRRSVGMATAVGLIYVCYWLLFGDTSKIDTHGSTNYRRDLLRIALTFVADHPLIGRLDFYSDPRFEPLRQGQGIIDITNMYLQIALHYGLIGLSLFSCIFLHPLIRGAHSILVFNRIEQARRRDVFRTLPDQMSSSRDDSPHDVGDPKRQASPDTDRWQRTCACLVALLVGWLFLIATTSDVGLALHIGIFLTALLAVVVEAAVKSSPATSDAPGESSTEEAARETTPGRMPVSPA